MSVAAVSAEAARAELAAVLASGTFARARSLSSLLSYLCEKQLSGGGDQLKEYTIAVEAYGRAADFQQKENSIVRVEIKRLRDKLRHYYETEGADHEVQISIPVGQYVPVFLPRESVTQTAPPAPVNESLPAQAKAPATISADSSPNLEAEVARGRSSIESGRWRWLGISAGVVLAVVVSLLALKPWRSSDAHTSTDAARSTTNLPATNNVSATADTEEIRILAGTQAAKYIDRAGRVWSGDRYFTGGAPFKTAKPLIYRTLDPEMYQAGRQGDFSYDIPLKPGVYELRLHFAENFHGPEEPQGGGETSRLFAVSANDQPLLRPLDILSEADGSRTAEIKVFKDISPAADGLLHLRFYSWTNGKALVNALEILPARAGAMRPIRFTTHDKPIFTSDGREWLPDGYFKGGRTIPRPGNVLGTSEPELYQSERFGHFSYAIPVAPGRYTVTLHFAERFFGPANPAPTGKGPGSRVFHVFCNGAWLLKNFDIYQAAGSQHVAVVRKFSGLTPNEQDKLLLEFKPVANYPLVNAIEVVDEAWK